MADYTYDQLKETTELDKGIVEQYKNSNTTIGKTIYNQAKSELETNTVLLDEYATAWKDQQQKLQEQKEQAATKEISDKISDLEQENKFLSQQLNIADGDYKDKLEESISDNNLQIANLKAINDGATYSHSDELYYEKTGEAAGVELTAPDVDPEHAKMFISEQGAETERHLGTFNALKDIADETENLTIEDVKALTRWVKDDDKRSVKDDLKQDAKYLYSTEHNPDGSSSPDAGYMTYKFDNALEEATQDALNNAKVNVPKAADTKLDKDAAATVNDDFDVFADANIDSRNLQASYDDPAISKYIEDLNDDVAINHIFSNTFYRIPAVPHWAYSVDFIPTTELLSSIKSIDVYTLSKFLTKSVISLTLPAREMSSTVSNYKGLTVELPARAKTSGELSFTFAETESFIMSEILEQLLKYARNDMFYEFDSAIVSNYLANTQNADIKQYADNIDMMNSAIAAYRKFIDNYAHEFNILVKLYRAADAKAFGDTNKNEYPTFVYFFKGCDVAGVKQFKLDYNSDKPIDIGASFMYQYFEEMTYEEYLLRYGGWNDGLDDPLLEASQEEMIAAADAANPLTLVTHRDVYNANLERS